MSAATQDKRSKTTDRQVFFYPSSVKFTPDAVAEWPSKPEESTEECLARGMPPGLVGKIIDPLTHVCDFRQSLLITKGGGFPTTRYAGSQAAVSGQHNLGARTELTGVGWNCLSPHHMAKRGGCRQPGVSLSAPFLAAGVGPLRGLERPARCFRCTKSWSVTNFMVELLRNCFLIANISRKAWKFPSSCARLP